MKSKFIKAFFLFSLSILLFSSCSGECKHKKMSEDIIPPSCGEHGYTVFMCVDCSFSFKSDYVEPTPHKIISSVTDPTCTSTGYTSYECEDCGFNYMSDATPTVPHSIISTVTPPSCEVGGYTSYACSECSFSYTADYVNATSHSFNSFVTPPTCTEEGYTTKTCEVCKTSIITDYTKPTGHSLGTTRYYATSSSDGYTFNDCSKCTYSFSASFEYSSEIFTGAYTASSTPLAKGIDVSSYNGNVDWNKVAEADIDFAIIRAGSSKSGVDPYFEINYKMARLVGIELGAYYYVEATSVNEILNYAEMLEDIIKDKKFEYPIYLDFEKAELAETLGKDQLTSICSAFIEKLQSDGYFTAIYTNNNWLENYFHKDIITDKYDVWYARYLSDDAIGTAKWDLAKYGTTMGIWQYTDEGSLSGLTTPVDLNIAYKDYPTIIKKHHYNGY